MLVGNDILEYVLSKSAKEREHFTAQDILKRLKAKAKTQEEEGLNTLGGLSNKDFCLADRYLEGSDVFDTFVTKPDRWANVDTCRQM